MSLGFPDPEQEVRVALMKGLPANDLCRLILSGATSGRLVALQMFSMKLEDVSAGELNRQRYTGWKYLAVADDGAGVVVHVTAPSAGRPARVAAVQRGPHIAKTLAALKQVQPPPGLPPDRLEVSLLNVPALTLEAFWLRPRGAAAVGQSWVVPFHSLLRIGIEATNTYLIGDFFTRIQPVVSNRLQLDD